MAVKGCVGLLIGRFQPFHNGHLKAIEWILGRCEKLIVLVGSSQACFEVENPFTVGERVEMIHRTLAAQGIADKCIVLSVPDIKNNALWVAHINSLVPRYDVVFSNNPLTKRLFGEAGKEVVEIPFFKRSHHDGTRIRGSMLRNDEWRKRVPKEVEKFIDKVDGVQRVKEVYKGDKD